MTEIILQTQGSHVLVLVPEPAPGRVASGVMNTQLLHTTCSHNFCQYNCSPTRSLPKTTHLYKVLILSLLLASPSDDTSYPALEQSQCFGLQVTGPPL